MVLVGDRRPEQRHDPVAGELVDGALVPVDAVCEELEQTVHHLTPLLGVDPLGELHRPGDVGEQDRRVLALAGRLGGAGAGPLAKLLRSREGRRGTIGVSSLPQAAQKRDPGGLPCPHPVQ